MSPDRERLGAPPTGAAAIVPGTEIDARFLVAELLAEGGMSRVYRARDRSGDLVILKVLRSDLASPRHAVERLTVEARACAELSGPNLRKLIASGRLADGAPYLALTYFAGPTLSAALVGSKMSIAGALQLGAELASVLDEIHRRRLVHCDVNPSNVILHERDVGNSTRAVAALIDFATCRRVSAAASSELTSLPGSVGTLAYMAPEQLNGSHVDARTDLYALGAILYECVTGRTALAAQGEALTSPSSLRTDCPVDLERAIQRALARDPEDRWASARRFGEELAWMQARLGLGLLRRWREEPAADDPTGNLEWSPFPNKSGVRRREP